MSADTADFTSVTLPHRSTMPIGIGGKPARSIFDWPASGMARPT